MRWIHKLRESAPNHRADLARCDDRAYVAFPGTTARGGIEKLDLSPFYLAEA